MYAVYRHNLHYSTLICFIYFMRYNFFPNFQSFLHQYIPYFPTPIAHLVLPILRNSFTYVCQLDSNLYQYILKPSQSYSKDLTVDRSVAALRLRSMIVLVMAGSEMYAGAVRCALWAQGQLNAQQQEMLYKNVLFLSTAVSAHTAWKTVTTPKWYE